MATSGFNGRKLTVDWETVTIVGVREKTVSINNEYPDITSDDDIGFQTFLPIPGKRSASFTVSGVYSSETLLAAMMAADAAIATGTVTVNLPSALAVPGDIEGEGVIQSLEITGADPEAVQFTVTIASSGAFAYTASAAS
jgi:predicted secreted protein